MTRTIVKALHPGGGVSYYASLSECCRDYGIRYEESLKNLVENAGLAPDGKTFFDYPTKQEIEDINKGRITLIYDATRRRRKNESAEDS